MERLGKLCFVMAKLSFSKYFRYDQEFGTEENY